jgi:hypothetical protein
MSHNPMGLHGLLQGKVSFFFLITVHRRVELPTCDDNVKVGIFFYDTEIWKQSFQEETWMKERHKNCNQKIFYYDEKFNDIYSSHSLVM